MRVLVIAPEAGIWSNTTSLADSVNSSVKAYRELGATVRIYSPFYEGDPESPQNFIGVYHGQERVRGESYTILQEKKESPFFYVQNQAYFTRSGHYADVDQLPYWDNHYRFSLFVSAAMQHAASDGFIPDMIHAHEWGGALAGAYAHKVYNDIYGSVPVILTIHNLEYDFHFLEQDIERIGLDRRDFNMDGFEFWGKVSLLKAGILYANRVVFASDGYCQQILERDLAGGIRGFLERNQKKVMGIQHGIDYERWSSFSGKNLVDQKSTFKREMQANLGLEQNDNFLVYCHLDKDTLRTADTLYTILSDLFHMPIQLVVGISSSFMDSEYMLALAQQNSGRMAIASLDSSPKALQAALASADLLFLSNSDEPSASLILKALANGAIPLCGKDIGCADLLTSYEESNIKTANALLVDDPWPDQMLRYLRLGIDLYTNDRAQWRQLVTNAFAFRYTWSQTASSYLKLKS